MATRRDPWLLAVWPGMGNVAFLAGNYLIEVLDPTEMIELDPGEHFEISAVDVEEGVIEIPRLPRSVLYRWKNPTGRDLLILIGEAQPTANGYEFCRKILEVAAEQGVKRVVTLAASPAELEPDDLPGIQAVVNHKRLLATVERLGVPLMTEGRITGLNGVFLGAAASRKIDGICFLGEIPFYAIPFPNPGTSLVLLEALSRLSGIEFPLEGLKARAEAAQQTIEAVYRSMQEAAIAARSGDFDDDDDDDDEDEEEDEENGGEQHEAAVKPALPPEAVRRIEELFREAAENRERALDLKKELDRWGVFKEYEDRFLDLFKKNGRS